MMTEPERTATAAEAAARLAAADAVSDAATQLRDAQRELEMAILAYRRAGGSMAAIAAAAGYSAPGVLGILRRHGVA